MTITVYAKPGCVQCDATERAMDRKGIGHLTVDVTKDPEALERIKALGYIASPRRRHRPRPLVRIPSRQD